MKIKGIGYFPVRSWLKPDNMKISWTVYTNFFYKFCQDNSGFENNDNRCVHTVKNAPIIVPLREFEETLIHAFGIQGFDIRKRVKSKKKFVDTFPEYCIENDYHNPNNFRKPLQGDEYFLPQCYLENTCYET